MDSDLEPMDNDLDPFAAAPEVEDVLDQNLEPVDGSSGMIPLDPDGWLSLNDGSRLQLVDHDRDGSLEVSVQVFDDGWVVGRDIDTDHPVFEAYNSDGEFIDYVDQPDQSDHPDGQDHAADDQPEPTPWPDDTEISPEREPVPVEDPLMGDPNEDHGLVFTVDGQQFTTPEPDLDLDGDGTTESVAITDENGNVVVMADVDGDGRADHAFVETEQGNVILVFDGNRWVADEESMEPTSDPDGTGDGQQSGGHVESPAEFRREVDPSAPWQVQNLQRAQDNFAVAVAELWSTAYPGNQWPVDDSGHPYDPYVLARVIAADAELEPAVTRMADDFVAHWDTLQQGVLNSAGTAALGTMADAGRCCDTSGGGIATWTIPLADGSSLTFNDSDLDGDVDVLVRRYENHYVVTTNADGPTPVHLTFTSSGEFLDRSDGADSAQPESEEPVWEESTRPVEDRQDNQDAMRNEVREDSAFWYLQEGQTCALASVVQVVEDFLGHDVDPNAVKEYALQMGWYIEGEGTLPDRVDDIMTHFGVPADSLQLNADSALTQIDQWTHQGVAVITFVDAAAYWSDTLWPDSMGPAPHAVRVLDVDFDQGVVILSDTGNPDGQGLEVPLRQFEEAMSGMNYEVVTSLDTDPDGVGAAAGAGPLAESGFVFLPMLITENPTWHRFIEAVRGL